MKEQLLTREQAAIAFAEGKKVEFHGYDDETWVPVKYFNTFDTYRSFRLKPEPRKVPLGPEDIDLHRDLFRNVGWDKDSYCIAVQLGAKGIWLRRSSYASWDELADSWQISRDGGKTWQTCEKEIES